MKKQVGFIYLLFIVSMPGFAQWKELTSHPYRQLKTIIKVEINQTENKTKVTHLASGKMAVLDHCAEDCSRADNFICLKLVHVIDAHRTEVIFRVYRTPGFQFLREIHLFRKTYDYTKVDFGKEYGAYTTYPNGKAIFFVLHETAEGGPVGKEAYLFAGEDLGQEKVIPLADRKRSFWINDKVTELTTVTATKRVFKQSLETGEAIWELGPDNFTCNWLNYAPQLVLNRYLCLQGIKDQGSMYSYYFVDTKTGTVLDTLFSNESIGRLTLVDHCKTLSERTKQE